VQEGAARNQAGEGESMIKVDWVTKVMELGVAYEDDTPDAKKFGKHFVVRFDSDLLLFMSFRRAFISLAISELLLLKTTFDSCDLAISECIDIPFSDNSLSR